MMMKPDIGPTNERLSAKLKKWKVTPELPVEFKSTVWRRISSSESVRTKGLELLLRWCSVLGNRQGFVAGYLSFALFIGVYLGLAHVKSDSEKFRNVMGDRYVSLVDPSVHSNR